MTNQHPNDFINAVISRASVNPEKSALVGPGLNALTYKSVSDLLLDAEPTQGLAVVLVDNSIESVCSYLYASSKYEAVVVLADLNFVDLGSLKEAWRPRAVLTSRQLGIDPAKEKPRTYAGVTFFENELVGADWESIGSENQLLLGTSGSTGGKKFVRLSSRSVSANAGSIASALNMSEADSTLSILPLSYSYGLSVLHSTLLAGGKYTAMTVDFLSKRNKEMFMELGVTQIQGVPSTYDLFKKVGLITSPPKSVKLFTQAGGKMSSDKVLSYASLLRNSGVGLSVMYGQTEATARMSIMPPELTHDFPEKAGYAVSHSSFLETEGTSDNLVFKGPGVMLGYAQTFEDLKKGDECKGVLDTGDLGFLESGLVEITGRKKRVAKVEGVRYSLDHLDSIFSKRARCATIEADGLIHVFTESKAISSAELVRMEPRLRERNLVVWNGVRLPLAESGKVEFDKLKKMI